MIPLRYTIKNVDLLHEMPFTVKSISGNKHTASATKTSIGRFRSNKENRTKGRRSKRDFPMLALIIVLCFVFYANTIPNRYSLDDQFVTNTNVLVQKGIIGIPKLFTSLYALEKNSSYGYRPVVQTTFAIEYQFFGANPHVSHFINILLYIACVLLLFNILKKLFRKVNTFFFIVVIILYASHPVHTEVIASLKNRDEMLALLGSFCSLHYFLRYTDNKKITMIIYAVLCYLFAYLSKPSAGIFLLIIPLTIYYYQGFQVRNILISFLTIGIITVLVGFGPRFFLPPPDRVRLFFENPLLFEDNIWVKTATGFRILLFYLKLLIFPHPLVFYYGYNMIPIVNWNHIWSLLSLVIYAGLFVFALLGIKKRSLISFALFFYLISIVGYSNIYKPVMGIVAERFMFMPSIAFAIFTAWLIFKLSKTNMNQTIIGSKERKLILTMLIIICIPYFLKTFTRNKAWKDHLTLYANDISNLDQSAKANVLYAGELIKDAYNDVSQTGNINRNRENIELAVKHYEQALQIYPKYYVAWNNIGSIYFTFFNKYEKSIPYFVKAIEVNPIFLDALFNLAFAYEMVGKTDLAIKYYHAAIDINPAYAEPYKNLSKILDGKGDYQEVIKINQKLIEANPDSDIPYINLGNHYMSIADTTNAINNYEMAFKKFPSNDKLAFFLSDYFRYTGEQEKSNYYYFKAQEKEKNRK